MSEWGNLALVMWGYPSVIMRASAIPSARSDSPAAQVALGRRVSPAVVSCTGPPTCAWSVVGGGVLIVVESPPGVYYTLQCVEYVFVYRGIRLPTRKDTRG